MNFFNKLTNIFHPDYEKTYNPFTELGSQNRNSIIADPVIDIIKPNEVLITKVDDKINIINVIDILPWNLKRQWNIRNIDKIKYLVVHQMASNGSLEAINNYHITAPNHISPKGCPHICYTYWVGLDGKIYLCNELQHTIWHVGNFNSISLGIGLQGNFNGPSYYGGLLKIPFTQKNSLRNLLNYLLKNYMFIERKNVVGHCELDPKNKENCPGNDIMNFVKQYREEL